MVMSLQRAHFSLPNAVFSARDINKSPIFETKKPLFLLRHILVARIQISGFPIRFSPIPGKNITNYFWVVPLYFIRIS
jgi:hypothetical protein